MEKLNGCFLIKNDNLLEEYNPTQGKASSDIAKEFASEPVYKKDFLKTKIKSYGDEVTDFYDKEIPTVDCNLNLLSSNQLGFCSQER